MHRIPTLVALRHDHRVAGADVAIHAQWGGHHFEVLLRGDVLAAARPTLLAHLDEVTAVQDALAQASFQARCDRANIFTQVEVLGFYDVRYNGKGQRPTDLLVLHGLRYPDRNGTVIGVGSLATEDACVAA